MTVFNLGIDDIGVLPREVKIHLQTMPDWFTHDEQTNTRAQIIADQHGDYNITEHIIGCAKQCTLYDNGVKVLEWHFGEDGCLVVQAYTEQQVNLFTSLELKQGLIKAKGPLFIKGKIECESLLAIDAEALYFSDEIVSKGDVCLNVRQGVGFLAPVTANNLKIHAAYVHQGADLQLSGQLNITAQCFKQEPSSVKTHVKQFSLITKQCEMQGELKVEEHCFLTANVLILGSKIGQSTFQLPRHKHIHAANLSLHGDTQVFLGNKNAKNDGTFIIDKKLFIDELAVLDIHHTKCSISKVNNKGTFVFDNCDTALATLNQRGIFDAHKSQLVLTKEINQYPSALTELKNCIVTVPITNVLGGEFIAHNTAYKAKICEIFDGFFTFNARSELNTKQLFLAKKAHVRATECTLTISESIDSSGTLSFEKTDITTKNLTALSGAFSSKNSIIVSDALIQLNGITDINESTLSGSIVTIDGTIGINTLKLNASNLKIFTDQANIDSLYTNSNLLCLNGSAQAEQVIFNNSKIETKLLTLSGHMTFNSSFFYGVSKDKVLHDIKGRLKFNNSQFLTKDNLANYLKGEIELEKNSKMVVSLLHSQGAMKARDSLLVCDNLWAEKAQFNFDCSKLKVKETLKTNNCGLDFSKGSELQFSKGFLEKNSELTLQSESKLIANSLIVNDHSSKISANKTEIKAKKFNALGRTELCSSLLSADELCIYNQFTVQSMSHINIDGLIAVAKNAAMHVNSSMVDANELCTFGQMQVDDTVLNVKHDLNVFSTAELEVKGRSKLTAENMLVRGQILVQAKPATDPTDPIDPKKIDSFIQVKKKLHVTKEAQIKGTANVSIEAEQYLHTGSLDINGTVRITGDRLTNHGSLKADELFCGFDDQIRNFGSLSADQIQIFSNFLNIYGQVYSKKSLSVAGFYGVNLGLIAANNYSNSTLISANLGLALPNFNADYDYYLNQSNLYALLKIAATTLLPGWSSTINAVPMLMNLVPMLMELLPALKDFKLEDLNSVFKYFNLERYKNMRRHELMAELSMLKRVLSSVYGGFNMAYSLYGELATIPSASFESWQNSSLFDFENYTLDTFRSSAVSVATNLDYKNLSKRSAGVFFGSYSDDSLININLGATLSTTTSKRSILSINTGAELSLLANNNDSQLFFNSGLRIGCDENVSTRYAFNAGQIYGVDHFTFKGKQAINTGTMTGNHACIILDKLIQEGTVTLDNGYIKIYDLQQNNRWSANHCVGEIGRFRDTVESKTQDSNCYYTGDSYRAIGTVDATNVTFKFKDEFILDVESKTTTNNVFVETKHFEAGGILDYQQKLHVVAKTALVKEGAVIQGQTTSEDQLFVPQSPSTDDTTPIANDTNPPTESTTTSTPDSITPSAESMVTPLDETPVSLDSTPAEDSTPETTTSDSTDVKKDFKPQHFFIIEADQIELDQKQLTGGDYTILRGKGVEQDDGTVIYGACDLKIGESAHMNLTYGELLAKNADIAGQAHLTSFVVDIDKTTVHGGNAVYELNKCEVSGKELTNQDKATFKLTDTKATIDNVILEQSANELINNSAIYAKKITDDSNLSYQGQAQFYTDSYVHHGNVTHGLLPDGSNDEKGLFYVKAKTGELIGTADLDHAIFDIDSFPDAVQFAAGLGHYSNYRVSDSLEIDTSAHINLNTALNRNCDLTVKGTGIVLNTDYNNAHNLTLISTETDVDLLANINCANVYVKSAANIKNNHAIKATGKAFFEAEKGFYNVGGSVKGDVVSIKASEIKNITPTPAPPPRKIINANPMKKFQKKYKINSTETIPLDTAWGITMGSEGVISSTTGTYLDATTGSIENCGGYIGSSGYTQLIAKGDIINKCNVRTYRGSYGLVSAFDPGVIFGGNGADTEGIGLYVKANGRVLSDASHFLGTGSNYIEGDLGIEFSARQETHITEMKRHKSWYGKSSNSVTTSTSISSCLVQSETGVSMLISEHGGIKSVAANFISPGGTQMRARDSIELFSLKVKNHKYKTSSSLWGLSKHFSSEMHEEATPTLFIDDGVTCIQTTQGSIDASGAYFAGKGDLKLIADLGRIKFSTDILDNEVVEKNRGFGISAPGLGAWKSWNSDHNMFNSLSAEDSTLAKTNALLGSKNTQEWLANSWNLGTNAYNTTNSFLRGLGNNNITDELLARYNLGGVGGKGFSPTASLSLTETTTKSNYQTQALGGVNRGGNVFLKAGEQIELNNGVRIHCDGSMIVDTPKLVLNAAELNSSVKQTTYTQSLGVSAHGVLDTSLGYSRNNTTSISYINAELSAGKHMTLGYQGGAMQQATLNGGQIRAQSMSGQIDILNITDKQDISTTRSESLTVGLSGQVSAYIGSGDSATVREHSGLYVEDNTGNSIAIHEVHQVGGEIKVNGGQLTIDLIDAQQLIDHQSYTGFGGSVNINDLQRLAGQTATNSVGEQAVAVGEINYDHVDYKTQHTPVIYGTPDTQITLNHVVGEIHTDSADGTRVIKNKETHITFDAPITNKDYIEKSRENIRVGLERIASGLASKFPAFNDPTLPSRRRKEEDSEELSETDGNELDLDKPQNLEAFEERKEQLLEEMNNCLDTLVKQFQNGEIHSDTVSEFSNLFKIVVNTVGKAGAEDLWGKLVNEVGKTSATKVFDALKSPKTLSKFTAKEFLELKKYLYVNILFNLFDASLQGKKHIWESAIESTIGDIFLDRLLTYAGAYKGTIGWQLIAAGIWDQVFYSKQIINSYYEQSHQLSDEARAAYKNKDYFAGFALRRAADAHIRNAANMQMIHSVVSLPAFIGKKVRELSSGVSHSSVPKNRNSLFTPKKTEHMEPKKQGGMNCFFKEKQTQDIDNYALNMNQMKSAAI